MKRGKRYQEAAKLIEKGKLYEAKEALDIIEKFPKTLYATGDISLLNREHILGMVGSRKCSEYGRKVADIFARDLSKSNITIISGLAIGIDAASLIGAIDEIR